jgi:hypothetical protein
VVAVEVAVEVGVVVGVEEMNSQYKVLKQSCYSLFLYSHLFHPLQPDRHT